MCTSSQSIWTFLLNWAYVLVKIAMSYNVQLRKFGIGVDLWAKFGKFSRRRRIVKFFPYQSRYTWCISSLSLCFLFYLHIISQAHHYRKAQMLHTLQIFCFSHPIFLSNTQKDPLFNWPSYKSPSGESISHSFQSVTLIYPSFYLSVAFVFSQLKGHFTQ